MTAPAERVATEFAEAFGGKPEGRWWAPGRVNLIGEHTDYNDGFVLPLALAQGVAAAARVADEPVLRVRSAQLGATVEVPLATIAPGVPDGLGGATSRGSPGPCGRPAATCRGWTWSSTATPGARACRRRRPWSARWPSRGTTSADWGSRSTTLAAAARRAENDVVGAPTGVMDQMASLHGRAGHLVFLDTRSLAVEPVPFDPPSAGLALLVIDSKAPHALVEGEYAERRRSCEQAAAILGVPALRDVTVGDLDAALDRLDDDLLRRRVRHVVTENARVLEVVAALRAGDDPRTIGPALTASHASMRDDFEITVPEIDTAATAALDAGAHGARMTGGGFGGCVLALVDTDAVEPVVRAVEVAYDAAGFRPPVAFMATAADGARRL